MLHIHIRYCDAEISINLKTFEITDNGKFPSDKKKLALKHVKENSDKYLNCWENISITGRYVLENLKYVINIKTIVSQFRE